MLVRPTTDVDPGSEPDTDNNSSDDKTRRDTEHHRIIRSILRSVLRFTD
jgi:hypothetical protein